MATYDLDRGMTLTRFLDAPPADVFAGWTVPSHLGWYFNPTTTTDLPATVDLRVGGEWRIHMVENADRQYMTGGLYHEVVPAERLAFYWGAQGGWPALDPARPDENPLVTLDFVTQGAGTRMGLRLQLPDSMTAEQADWWMNCGMIPGWHMTIDRLVAVHATQKAD